MCYAFCNAINTKYKVCCLLKIAFFFFFFFFFFAFKYQQYHLVYIQLAIDWSEIDIAWLLCKCHVKLLGKWSPRGNSKSLAISFCYQLRCSINGNSFIDDQIPWNCLTCTNSSVTLLWKYRDKSLTRRQ